MFRAISSQPALKLKEEEHSLRRKVEKEGQLKQLGGSQNSSPQALLEATEGNGRGSKEDVRREATVGGAMTKRRVSGLL